MRPRSKLIVGSLMMVAPFVALLVFIATMVGVWATIAGTVCVVLATAWFVTGATLLAKPRSTPTQPEDH